MKDESTAAGATGLADFVNAFHEMLDKYADVVHNRATAVLDMAEVGSLNRLLKDAVTYLYDMAAKQEETGAEEEALNTDKLAGIVRRAQTCVTLAAESNALVMKYATNPAPLVRQLVAKMLSCGRCWSSCVPYRVPCRCRACRVRLRRSC
jgi:hypothetical protein